MRQSSPRGSKPMGKDFFRFYDRMRAPCNEADRWRATRALEETVSRL